MSTVIDVADALTRSLNDGEFSLPFTAERLLLPEFELGDMDNLHVTVVPKSIRTSSLGRGQMQRDVEIDVAVQRRYREAVPEEIDPLMVLVDEIAEAYPGKRLETYPLASCLKVTNDPIYAPEHMQEYRQFTSLLTFLFRIAR